MLRLFVFLFVCILPCAAGAMAQRRPLIYGSPTLYGEYEITDEDICRANKMYGAMPRADARPSPIVARENTNRPAAKHPVKTKHVMPKKSKKAVKKGTPQKPKVIDDIVVPDKKEIVVANVGAPAPSDTTTTDTQKNTAKNMPKIPAIPGEFATGIATAASYKYDVNSYCTQTKPVYTGNLPDGIILMPGRPDLMSCVEK